MTFARVDKERPMSVRQQQKLLVTVFGEMDRDPWTPPVYHCRYCGEGFSNPDARRFHTENCYTIRKPA